MNRATQGVREAPFPAQSLRAQFPALQHAGAFIFFDNAAGAQIPQLVFDAVNRHLLEHNVQRGGRYPQSIAVDRTIQRARSSVASFVNARRPEEIAFGMNATSFVRLISLAIGQTLAARNEIIVTDLDHEANIATWLALERMGAKFRWWHAREDACLHLDDLKPLLSSRTRLLACAPASNALGGVLDVRSAADLVHGAGGEIFLDAVHYGPHAPTDVQAFDCDYLVCSGYKIFGPHMGFCWGRRELLEAMPAFLTGGEMIRDVRLDGFTTNDIPWKFEAGTPPIAEAIGLGTAIDYLRGIGMGAVRSHEQALTSYAMKALKERYGDEIVIYGPPPSAPRAGIVSFSYKDIHAHDLSQVLDEVGVCVRAGHHCAKPLMRCLGVGATARASFSVYNDEADVDALVDAIGAADALFG